MANQAGLIAGIKVLVDAGKDVVAALQPGQSLSQKFADFENLIGDALAAASAGGVSEIQAEIKLLQPADYASLAGVVVADCGFTSAHAQAIVPVALKVLGDVGAEILPDALALIAVIKNAPAA